MLKIAIQSKGRLNEESLALLRDAGIRAGGGSRTLLSKAEGFGMEILYLRDDDIPQAVAMGVADIGIVGLNEVAEKGYDVCRVMDLGFGRCRISIAVPRDAGYDSASWLNGKRIATSYPGILSSWLMSEGIDAEIHEIAGSVEIAPAVGMADAIFDIVSSGGTLVSNGLKEVERVFESEAALIACRDLSAEDRALLDELLFRIESERVSRGKKYLLMNIPTSALDAAVKILPAMRSPTVMPLAAEGWCSLHSVVEASDLWDKVRQLKAIGAEGILVLTLDKIIP